MNVATASTADTTTDATDAKVAVVLGAAFHELPQDLYIPPEALHVFLDAFSGPLDLLLYLIKKQNINILDIPIAKITVQYVEYLELMQQLKLELAAEYLLMAAMLAEIKSKLLLPQRSAEEKAEEDPRAELVKRLQEYEYYKNLAENLDNLPRCERDVFTLAVDAPPVQTEKKLPEIDLRDLVTAFNDVMQRVATAAHHKIKLENLSVRERMTHILDKLQGGGAVSFTDFFHLAEGKQGVVVTFLALLELLREKVIAIVQAEAFGNIYLQSVKNND